MKSITLKIGGMSCSACSNSLEKYLNKQPGIINATVNLVLACASIDYEESININTINNYIKSSGFEPLGIFKLDDERSNKRKRIITLLSFSVLTIIFLYLAMGHMLHIPTPKIINHHLNPKNYAISLLILTIPYIIYGLHIFKNGIKNIFYLSPNMDTLVTLGFIASFIYSLVNTILLLTNKTTTANNLYYDCCIVIIFFVNLGRVIDTNAKEKTKMAIKDLVQITPNMAFLKTNDGFKEVTIDEVQVDDILIAKAGDKIAVDGIIVNGTCYTDESFLTGESKPVKKVQDSKVIAGSIVQNGYVEYAAKKIGKDSTVSEIVRLVVNATNSKANISRVADKVSSYFVPSIMVIALVTMITYLIIGKGFEEAITTFVSVLVVACPCALGLATPLAIVISTGTLANQGILVKKGSILEIACKTNMIVFDKTGTLTYGKLSISKVIEYLPDYMQYVVSLEAKSNHPISNTFVNYAKNNKIDLLEVSDFEILEGIGIKGIIDNKLIYLGNSKLFNIIKMKNTYENDEISLKEKGNSIVYVIIDNQVHAIIGISDIIKDEAKTVIEKLQKQNIETIMLTGDNKETAEIVGKELGITNIISNVLPVEKVNKIKELTQDNNCVMMVGDGINDAPALTEANIGVGINNGTDIALNASDVIIMNNDLNKILNIINISKKTIRNIKQNLFWAFFYNILMIPIAIGIFKSFGISLNPMFAGIGMTLSSLTVILNALRLLKLNRKEI
ncbi:MAG: copper-translocating P-type ATPase [Bacilli bacterium]|nr:copper-translocating P-type ATPase [Bacilli bacterium]